MGLGIARSFAEGPVCHRVSNGHRSSCLVSDYGPANNLEISTTPTLFSMLLNAVSPPPANQVMTIKKMRGDGDPAILGNLLTTWKEQSWSPTLSSCLSGSKMPSPPHIPPRPVPASGSITRLVFPLPLFPNPNNHEIETWHYRTETTPFDRHYPMGHQHKAHTFPVFVASTSLDIPGLASPTSRGPWCRGVFQFMPLDCVGWWMKCLLHWDPCLAICLVQCWGRFRDGGCLFEYCMGGRYQGML